MGRPYADEIALLQRSYEFALAYDWSVVERSIVGNFGRTLVSVGSGGSMTTAAWSVHLHRHIARGAAHTATPLALRTAIPSGGDTAVWLMSGSGKNPDILAALDTAVAGEPHEIIAMCASISNPLLKRAAKYPWIKSVGFKNPAGSDGFLATNSLFTTCVGLTKAFSRSGPPLPPTLAKLLEQVSPDFTRVAQLEDECERLWAQDTLIVLHGNSGAVAAMDIESRFTEAALGCVQIADFRNFAHGRHHWLAKRGERTAVLSISDTESCELAERTLRLLPSSVPVVRVHVEGDPATSGLAAIWFSIQLAGFAGKKRGIDPGRPGVPEFGRKIYNLKTRPRSPSQTIPTEIRRKMGDSVHSEPGDLLTRWTAALDEVREKLCSTPIEVVVLDYDGTLVEPSRRRDPPEPPIVEQLVRLLGLGLHLGIATGRGDSVRRDLRKILPVKYWPQVVVGYHNGCEIGSLDDDSIPPDGEPGELLRRVHAALLAAPFANLVKTRVGRAQVTVESGSFSEEQLWRLVHDVAHQHCGGDVRVVRSSHSVDVIESTTSKLQVIDYFVSSKVARRSELLCIGDRGRWPGNDFELLDHSLGLSVDEVSSRYDACWNFAAAGERGTVTAQRYLAGLKPSSRNKRKSIKLALDSIS